MASTTDPHELDEEQKNHTAESLEILELLYVNEFEKEVVALLGLCYDQEMSSIVNEGYENGGCLTNSLEDLTIDLQESVESDVDQPIVAMPATGSHEDNKNDVEQSIVASAHDEINVKGSSSGGHQLYLAGSLEDLTIDKSIVASTGSPIPETRCIGHYNNQQKILLVGEGDFSFASSLARAFGNAANLTATSLDSKETLILNYSKAGENLKYLQERGALVIHQVDVHTMDENIQLENKLFDRIVFNFPHAGNVSGSKCKEKSPWYIMCHQDLVKGFFEKARWMLTQNGEIHVTHKTNYPFDKWDIVGLAEEAELELTREVFFDILDYPGYENKKAFRDWWDSTFPVGECYTFMFSSKT